MGDNCESGEHDQAVAEYARRILTKYEGVMDPAAAELAHDALKAGEFEVGAICAVEDSPCNGEEIDEFIRLAKRFYWSDAEIAHRVAEKARKRLRTAPEQ